jgi:hypothetical protein
MTKINSSTLLAAAFLLGGTAAAVAGPVCTGTTCTITNQTTVEAYSTQGGATTIGGSYWGTTGIGQPIYNTPQATVTFSASTDTVNISFETGLYTGVDNSFGSPVVHAADVFLNDLGANGVTTTKGGLPGMAGNTFYNYGISLGLDTADGGEAKGLYSLGENATDGTKASGGEYLTSQDVWNKQGNFDYGGRYGTAACAGDGVNCPTSSVAPTVVTGGTLVSGITVGTACYDQNNKAVACGGNTPDGDLGTLDVSLQANDLGAGTASQNLATNLAFLESLFSNYDLFWGTGDCSNAPIWGQVSQLTSAPEPSSLALFASAAMGWRLMRRRKRKVPSAA